MPGERLIPGCKRRSKNPSLKRPGCPVAPAQAADGPLSASDRGRGMKGVELYAQVRYAVPIEGVSRREAARRYGIDPRTVAKMLAFSVPPGYRRSRRPARPKLDPFSGIIDRILAEDEGRPRKQRHTSKRIFERLRDEHGYSGGITIVNSPLTKWLRHDSFALNSGSDSDGIGSAA